MKPQSSQKGPRDRSEKSFGKKGPVQNNPQFKGKPNKKRKPNGTTKNTPDPDSSSVRYVLSPHQLEHQMREVEKQKRRNEFKQKKEEKAKKFNEFRKRKMERNKILGQKTQRGQPVMKGRMEMLLNKIQYQMSK